jgi:hypothetical protein|tara:strand:- start:45 stop:548 length:504 start_codon:yes stop_codon:yes gene_type:complete
MVEQQILITIATIAVTLAGFSGVVGIFSKELSPIKSYKLETLLFQSGVALFASLTTLIASQIGGGLESEQEFRLFWSISSWAYISITVIALIFATIDIIKTEAYKNINYDILFYLSFFLVIALLIFNALYIQDAYLYHIALEINLAFAFVSFYTLVMPAKEKLPKKE